MDERGALVSVVIPIYNRVEFLADAVASVLAQTHQPIEVIVVDDGSTEDVAAAIARFGAGVRYVRQENRERGAARNLGLKIARGEFVAFLDSDDVWLPNKIERDLAAFDRCPDAGLVYSDVLHADARGRPFRRIHGPGHEGQVTERLLQSNFVTLSAHLLRRDVFRDAGGFREDRVLAGSEDWEAWVRLSRRTRFAHVPEATVCVRVHANNTMSNPDGMERAMEAACRIMAADGYLSPEQRRLLPRTRAMVALTNAINYGEAGQRARARRHLWSAVRAAPSVAADPRYVYTLLRVLLPVSFRSALRRAAHWFRRDAVDVPEGATAGIRAICLLVTDIDAETGGIQAHSRRLLAELTSRGITACVCTRNYHRRPRTERQGGVLIHRSPVLARSTRTLNSIVYLLDALVWLIRHRGEFQVLHCQQMYGSAMLGLIAKRLLGTPVLVRVTLTGETGEAAQVRRMPLARLRLRLLRQVDRWVALTPVMRDELVGLGIPGWRIAVIPNGAVLPPTPSFDPAARARARTALGIAHAKVVVYAGRLSHEKGVDTLLEGWPLVRRRHPDACLFILGEGGAYRNVEAELRESARRVGVTDVVRFCGHVPNVGDYLQAADVFVLPTRAEGMSNALVEAMASGAAIVTTDIPANRALVQDERTALLVAPGQPAALAGALVRVLDDAALAERLGREARDVAQRELSMQAVADRYIEVYRSVV